MTKAPIAAAFLLSTAIFTPINWAQTTQGQINGRVTDTSGAMIPGAEVEVVNPSTGVSQQISANEVGQYVIYVPFGTYDVRVSSLGFGTKLTTGVLVTTASETTVDVELDVETVAEQVSVSAAVAQLETSDTTIGAAIEENLMRHAPIPVQGQKRRPYQYISLSPGVNNTNGRGNVAGSRTLNTVIMLDGLSTETTNNGVGEQAVGTEPSVEAIGEYKLLLSNMSAEYGRSSGGLITYATKSGTNDLHGSVWNFHNNSFLNARPWQAAERANSRNNEFGIAGGGPVVIPKVYDGRNKTFFWSTLAYYRQSATGSPTNFLTLPTAAMRSGDFSHPDLNALYDRKDQFTDADNQVRFRPFANNQIPMSRQSRVSANVMQLLPIPTARDTPELNHVGAVASTFNPWDLTTKIDHQFNTNHRLSAFYMYGTAPRIETDPGGILDDSFGRTTFNSFQRVRADYSWVQSPRVVHQILFGFNYQQNGREQNNFGQGLSGQLGLTGMPSNECPWIQLARASSFGVSICANPPSNKESKIVPNWAYSTLWNKGRHTIKFGYQGQFWRINRHDQGGFAGGLTVGSSGTYLFGVSEGNLGSETKNTDGSGGFHLADFYLGLPNFVGTAAGLALEEREAYHAIYLQDDWKILPKLTLNLGIRWDVQMPFKENRGQFSGFDPTLANPGISGNYRGALEFYGMSEGANGRLRVGPATYGNFGPRLGLAYQITDKLVFRAGAGIQYMAIQNTNVRSVNRTGHEARGNPPQRTSPFAPYFEWDNGFPSSQLGTPPFIDPTFLNNQSVTNWMNPQTIGTPPSLYMITGGFQRQFGNWVLETTFYSNMGRNNADHERINDLHPDYWHLGPLLNLEISDPAVAAAGFGKPYPEFPDNLPLHRALRRFPQYGNVSNDAGINTGMNYNAFMLKATKRYSNGLSFLGHWTVAKQLGDVDWAPGAFGSNTRNSYNRKLDKRINRYDTTHRAVFNYSYDLPFGPGQRWGGTSAFSHYVLSGWTISGVQEYVNGFPISTSGGLSVGIPGGVRNLADRAPGVPWRSSIACGDMVFGDPERNFILNAGNPTQVTPSRPQAWLPPGDFVQGNAPEVDQETRQCPNFNEDLSVVKRIPLATEKVKLQIGADCFNCLNRHRWIAGRFGNNINSSTFGRIVPEQPKGPRTIQLRMRVEW